MSLCVQPAGSTSQFSAYIDYCNANNENIAIGNYKISNNYFIDIKKNDKKIITKRVTTGGNMLTSLSVMNNMPWNNNKRAFKRYEFSIDENEVPEYGLQGLAFRGDNFYISVDDGTGACKLYKLDRKGNVDNDYGKVLLPLEHGNNLAFSNDGKLYACSGSGSYNAKLFEISEDGKAIINTIDLSQYGKGATFTFDELGNIILSAKWVVYVIRFHDLQLLTTFNAPEEVSYENAGNPQGMIAYDGVIYFGSDKVICAMTYSGEVIESIDVTTRSGENEGITMMRDGFTTCIAQAQLNPKMITSLRPSDSLGNYKGVNMASAVTFSNNSQINPVGMELIDITITSGKITNFSGGSLFKDPVIKTHTDGKRIIEAEMKIPLFLMSPSVHCSIYTDVGADRVMGLIRQSSGKQYLMIKVIKDGVVVDPSLITILGIYCTIIGAMGYL
ncbi:hypothetical protein [Morganella morganii]|uniref:hypothetical protein n=1 Tax=Morganella morganii TaxID=582 RepID=UPI003EBB28A9